MDRLWPRGVKKEALKVDEWLPGFAPSDGLRRWKKWAEFRRRYWAELEKKSVQWKTLLDVLQEEEVTFVYAAKNREHNNAVALKEFLTRKSALPRRERTKTGVPRN